MATRSSTAMGDVLLLSGQLRHFGGGQTRTTLELSPGEHTLQLLFMDEGHLSFDPPVSSDVITITVK